MASAAEQSFDAFVSARWAPLRRTAYLLTGSDEAGDALLLHALVRLRRQWASVDRDGDPEAFVRRQLVLGSGRRPWSEALTRFGRRLWSRRGRVAPGRERVAPGREPVATPVPEPTSVPALAPVPVPGLTSVPTLADLLAAPEAATVAEREAAERHRVWCAVQALPARSRAIFVLDAAEEIGHDQQADALGGSSARRARDKAQAWRALRQLLDAG